MYLEKITFTCRQKRQIWYNQCSLATKATLHATPRRYCHHHFGYSSRYLLQYTANALQFMSHDTHFFLLIRYGKISPCIIFTFIAMNFAEVAYFDSYAQHLYNESYERCHLYPFMLLFTWLVVLSFFTVVAITKQTKPITWNLLFIGFRCRCRVHSVTVCRFHLSSSRFGLPSTIYRGYLSHVWKAWMRIRKKLHVCLSA